MRPQPFSAWPDANWQPSGQLVVLLQSENILSKFNRIKELIALYGNAFENYRYTWDELLVWYREMYECLEDIITESNMEGYSTSTQRWALNQKCYLAVQQSGVLSYLACENVTEVEKHGISITVNERHALSITVNKDFNINLNINRLVDYLRCRSYVREVHFKGCLITDEVVDKMMNLTSCYMAFTECIVACTTALQNISPENAKRLPIETLLVCDLKTKEKDRQDALKIIKKQEVKSTAESYYQAGKYHEAYSYLEKIMNNPKMLPDEKVVARQLLLEMGDKEELNTVKGDKELELAVTQYKLYCFYKHKNREIADSYLLKAFQARYPIVIEDHREEVEKLQQEKWFEELFTLVSKVKQKEDVSAIIALMNRIKKEQFFFTEKVLEPLLQHIVMLKKKNEFGYEFLVSIADVENPATLECYTRETRQAIADYLLAYSELSIVTKFIQFISRYASDKQLAELIEREKRLPTKFLDKPVITIQVHVMLKKLGFDAQPFPDANEVSLASYSGLWEKNKPEFNRLCAERGLNVPMLMAERSVARMTSRESDEGVYVKAGMTL